MLFLCNIANVGQRTFEIVQKSRARKYNWRANLSNFRCLFIGLYIYLHISLFQAVPCTRSVNVQTSDWLVEVQRSI